DQGTRQRDPTAGRSDGGRPVATGALVVGANPLPKTPPAGRAHRATRFAEHVKKIILVASRVQSPPRPRSSDDGELASDLFRLVQRYRVLPQRPWTFPHIAAVSAGDGCAKAHGGDPAVTGPAPRAR